MKRTTSSHVLFRFLISLLGLVLAVGLAASVQPAVAQDIIVEPTARPPVRPPDDTPTIVRPFVSPVEVTEHSLEATIDGSVAEVRVVQIFHNPTQMTLEAAYVFPLPADAAIGDLQLTVDGHVLEGEVYTAEEARRIYEEIVRRQRDPALLEYLGNGLYQTSVFPIPGGAYRTVELSYRQVLTLDNGLYRFSVPLGVRQGTAAPDVLSLGVELRNQPGLRTVYSPSHNVSIQRQGDDGAMIGFETSDPEAFEDFVLYFGTDESAIGLDLLSYNPAGEAGFFLLLAAPSVDAGAAGTVARDLVLVLDVSGSMEGDKVAQAQNAARYVVQHLNPGDRFNLISFSTGTDLWAGELQPAEPAAQKEALAWIGDLRANGSTDINRALLEALALLDPESSRPAYVLFLTDGLPTQGEREPQRIVDNAKQNAPRARTLRLFTFGVGYDVNTDLLDTVSSDLGGRSRYVRPDEAIDEAVSGFYASISTPVLSNVSITVEGAQVEDTYPFPLPDLFAGEQLVWAGRYDEGGPVTVVLRGMVNGQEQVFRYDDLSLASRGGESAVARLWATRKIGALLSEARRSGANQEIVDAIVDLSLTYGIVTPYTSYLVLEPDMRVGLDTTAAPAMGEGIAEEEGIGGAPMPTQPQALRSLADDAVAAEVAEEAAAAPAGEAAVEASIARAELEEAQVVQERQGVRYVAGKSFAQQGTVPGPDGAPVPFWVDTLFEESMSPRTVVFGSDAYFDLLAADERLADWLSLSPEMVVVVDGEAIRVTLSDEAAGTGVNSAPSMESTAPEEDANSSSAWGRAWQFLRRLFGR